LLQPSSQPIVGTSPVPSGESTHFAQEEEELARLVFQWEAKKLELDAKRLHLESKKQILAMAAEEEKFKEEAGAATAGTTIPLEDKRKDEVEPRKELEVLEEQPTNSNATIEREDQSHFRHVFQLELSTMTSRSTRTTPGATNKSDDGTTIWERMARKEVCSRCKRRGEACYRYTKSTGQYSACQGCVEMKAKCSTGDVYDPRGGRFANLSIAAKKRSFLYAGNHPEDADETRPKRARRETAKVARGTPPSHQVTIAGLTNRNRDLEILQGIEKLLHEQLHTRNVLEDIRGMLEFGGSIHPQVLSIDYENGPSVSAEIDEKEYME
jgi:hypothetical protein